MFGFPLSLKIPSNASIVFRYNRLPFYVSASAFVALSKSYDGKASLALLLGHPNYLHRDGSLNRVLLCLRLTTLLRLVGGIGYCYTLEHTVGIGFGHLLVYNAFLGCA
jgi:hypothetical protein